MHTKKKHKAGNIAPQQAQQSAPISYLRHFTSRTVDVEIRESSRTGVETRERSRTGGSGSRLSSPSGGIKTP